MSKKAEEKKQPAVIKNEITAQVLSKIQVFTATGELQLPKDFSPANALKGAMLMLDDMDALKKYDKASISMALLKMCVEGLSPIKSQGYFIAYGKQLTWSRSYQGSIALAKRVGGVSDVVANVVYEGDNFQFQVDPETGYKKIMIHEPSIKNIDNKKILGAYAVIIYTDGRRDLEVMTLAEIKEAWNMGATKGKSKAHEKFTQEMCKKTVINRACKGPINSSSDASLMDDGDENKLDLRSSVAEEIEETTASEEVEFEEVDENAVKEEPKEKEKTEEKPKEEAAGNGELFDNNGESEEEKEAPF